MVAGNAVLSHKIHTQLTPTSFVEYETMPDLRSAVDKLDNTDFKETPVRCIADVNVSFHPKLILPDTPKPQEERQGRDRYRSRSPSGYRRGGYPPGPPDDFEYGRRPARGYSPRREDYRRRSPPREYYDRYGRGSPRGAGGPRGPADEYSAPRPRYPEDAYDARGPPPPRRGGAPYEDPYANGHGGGRPPYAGGPPSPRRPRSPGRPPYDGYDRPRYW